MRRSRKKPADWRETFDQLITLLEQDLSDPTIDCLEKKMKRMGFTIVTEREGDRASATKSTYRVKIICVAKTEAAGREWVLDDRTIEPGVAA